MSLFFPHKTAIIVFSEKCVPISPLHKGSPVTER